MKPVLWSRLAVLLVLGVAATEGELCRVWASGLDSPIEVFGCPRPGAGDMMAKFCCGSCHAPRCCSLKEGRLDQQQCLAEARSKPTSPPEPLELELRIVLIMAWVLFGVLALICVLACVHCLFVHRCFCALHFLKSRNEEPQPMEMQVIDSSSGLPLVASASSLVAPSTSRAAANVYTVLPLSGVGPPQGHQESDDNTPLVCFHHEHSRVAGDGAMTSSPAPVPVGEAVAHISNVL